MYKIVTRWPARRSNRFLVKSKNVRASGSLRWRRIDILTSLLTFVWIGMNAFMRRWMSSAFLTDKWIWWWMKLQQPEDSSLLGRSVQHLSRNGLNTLLNSFHYHVWVFLASLHLSSRIRPEVVYATALWQRYKTLWGMCVNVPTGRNLVPE